MDDPSSTWHPESWLVAGGRDTRPGAPLNVGPQLASNFRLPADRTYSRSESTETVEAFESLLGGLDGGAALAFSSGMAAAAAVFDSLPVGARVVLPDDPYHGVGALVELGQEQGRWQARRLDLTDTGAWIAALGEADLVWLESPSNPLLDVADLPAVCGAPRPDGCVVAVDSTFATPLLQRPLELGADVVMHSATKFIGGHSDLLGGALVATRDDLTEAYRSQRALRGATVGALEAYLATRGARTLALRMARSQATAAELAERLATHAQVERVLYPGLSTHPTGAVAASFMDGAGAMLSFEVAGGAAAAAALCGAVELVCHATSLGGVETTMERRAAIAGQERIPPGLVRLSAGCEHVEDLWVDLARALDCAAAEAS